MKDKYTCVEYGSVFIKKSSFDKESKKAGSNPSDINLAMSAGAYCAIIGLLKLYQLCGETSIVCLAKGNITKKKKIS